MISTFGIISELACADCLSSLSIHLRFLLPCAFETLVRLELKGVALRPETDGFENR